MTKIAIITAGVLMNLLVAFLLFTILLSSNNFQVDIPTSLPTVGKSLQLSFPFGAQSDGVLIAYVDSGSPAEKGGLKQLDKVISANTGTFARVGDFQQFILENQGKEINMQVYNLLDRHSRMVKVTPAKNPAPGKGSLGVFLDSITTVRYGSLIEKIFVGPLHSTNMIYFQGRAIGSLFSQAIEQKSAQPVTENVRGPLGIVALLGVFIGKTGTASISALTENIALLSLMLALINILPIPALDGGRAFFLVLRSVGIPISARLEQSIHGVALAILVILFVIITIGDISNLPSLFGQL